MAASTSSSYPKAYRQRLLNVLLSQDIGVVMNRLGWTSKGDVLDNRFYLLDHWTDDVEIEMFKLIKERLAQ